MNKKLTNTKEEFLSTMKGKEDLIRCSFLELYNWNRNAILPMEYTDQQYYVFLDKCSQYNYYSGYGEQELYGYIWLKDGTWFERYEYDGSEKWVYKKYPEMPKGLKK